MLWALATALVVAAGIMALRRPPPRERLALHDAVRVVQQYLREGRLMEAMVISKKLVRDSPDVLRFRIVHVEVTRAIKGDDAALRELEELHALWPDELKIA